MTGEGQTISITNQYGTDPTTFTFCSTDQFELGKLNCGINKYPAVVLPKSCTHCQQVRCIDPRLFPRYDQWNNFQYLEITAYDDAHTWLYQCATYNSETSAFTKVYGWLPNADPSIAGVALFSEAELSQTGAQAVGHSTLACYQAGAATWQTLYFNYIGPEYFRNDYHVTKISDLVSDGFEDNFDQPHDQVYTPPDTDGALL